MELVEIILITLSFFAPNQWIWFPLSTPIQWDGRSNLIVEISKDESHASFSWPGDTFFFLSFFLSLSDPFEPTTCESATGGLLLKNTPNICCVAHKDNNDSSGAYPFSNWKNPTRFRKVPALSIEGSSLYFFFAIPLDSYASAPFPLLPFQLLPPLQTKSFALPLSTNSALD